jgi:asparagine synthase (glutamine-hydrolysing)
MARNMSEPVKTFSIGFEGTGEQNELNDAKLVSEQFGTDHHALELPLNAEVDLASLVWHLDEPLADLSSLGFLALSGLAREHVTVALSGQGADELFGGYRKHRAAALAGICHKRLGGLLVGGLTKPLVRAPGRYGRMARTLSAADPVARLLATSGNLPSGERERLFRGPLADVGGGQARQAALAALGTAELDPLGGALHLDGQMGLVDDMLHYFDRASMAHSLEVRVPFLDHEFVEFSSQIPPEYKVGPRFSTKHVLKQAARGLVPDRIIDKPKVGFFNRAVDGWIRAQLDGPIQRHLPDSSAHTADIFDPKVVEQLVRGHKAGRGTGAYVLLEILMLETWLQTYLPRALDTGSTGERLPAAESSGRR